MNKREQSIRSLLRNGDIILISNKKFNIISKGIMWFTASPWNHTVWYHSDSIEDSEDDLLIRKNDKWIYHWTTWRARRDPLKIFLSDEYKICVKRLLGLAPEKFKAIRDIAEEDVRLKNKYAKKAYLGYALANGIARIPVIGKPLGKWFKSMKNPWRQYNQKVCSSGIIERWFRKGTGLQLCRGIGEENVTPEDIYKTSMLNTVYEEI